MKKKLITFMAITTALSLVGCKQVDEAKESVKDKINDEISDVSKDIESYIDEATDISHHIQSYIDEETDLSIGKSSSADAPTEGSTEAGTADNFSPDLTFSISTTDGNTITEQVFAEHKITMINFWEPWCGPCVGEIPDLEKLYEHYKDQGFYIIGVYSTIGQDDEVNDIISTNGLTYPIAEYDSAFDPFQTGYVPTTIFVDQQGHVISMENGYGDNVLVGSNSYDKWSQIVENLLK